MNSIVIADAHTLCREALCEYLRQAAPGMIVDGVGSLDGLKDIVREQGADLVLIDAGLVDGNARAIGDLFPGAKLGLIVFSGASSHCAPGDVQGLFPKTLSSKAFLGGIEEILDGGTFFPANEYAAGMNRRPPPHIGRPATEGFDLTQREREVLSHLVKGASNKDIARALDLQVVTVKLHVRGICKKLKAANRTQAALTARELGWR